MADPTVYEQWYRTSNTVHCQARSSESQVSESGQRREWTKKKLGVLREGVRPHKVRDYSEVPQAMLRAGGATSLLVA